MVMQCTHLDSMRDVTPNTSGFEECLKTGDHWVRMCMSCGHVGCCDSRKTSTQPNNFMRATRSCAPESPVRGGWCCIDNIMLGWVYRWLGGSVIPDSILYNTQCSYDGYNLAQDGNCNN